MNDELITQLLHALKPAIKSQARAKQVLHTYLQDNIVLIWTVQQVHRAANERSTVLTEEEAKAILHRLLQQFDPQHGIDWRKLTETIDDSGLGRRIRRNELNQFIYRDVVAVQVVVEKIKPQ